MKEERFDTPPLPPETHEEQAAHAAPVLPETPAILPGASPPVSRESRRWRIPSFLLVILLGILVLAVLAGGTGLLVALVHRQPNTPPRLVLSACVVGGGLHARCGTLSVAENPSAPDGRKISLRVVVLPATTANRAADPLFYLAGGPGDAASDYATGAAQHFAILNQRHDIVLIDQRGTGESNQLTCSTAGLLSGLPSEAQIAALVQACLASIKDKADPRYYTTPIAVDDFDQVRAALGYDKIDLYGGSYGVSAALAYIQRHGAHVRAAVLDSGSLLDVHLWELVPRSAQQALTSLFARCRSSATCAAAFPNLPADFRAVTTRLSQAPIASAIVDPTTGAFLRLDLDTFLGLVIDYLSSPQESASFPKDIHAAARGDWTAIMKRFAGAVAGSSSSRQVMYLTIECSDEWASRDPSRVAAIAPGSPFTPLEVLVATRENMACKYWPHATGASGPVTSAAPIVFLNGTADPKDLLDTVANAQATMPNSLVVPVAGGGHGQFNYDPTGCLADAATTFLDLGVPSSPLWWPCAQSLPLPDFVV